MELKIIVFTFFLLNFKNVYCGYGGNDIFTSLQAMKYLWNEEIKFVEHLQDSIKTMETILPLFKRYVTNHEKLELNQDPNVDYLGHPINAYNLIKHSALGWEMFHEDIIPKLNDTLPKLDYILNRPNRSNIPDAHEIRGAAFGIARLHTLYDLDTDKMVQNGIINSNFGHAKIRSGPSVQKFSSFDLTVLGTVAKENGLYTTSIPAYESALNLVPFEKNGEIPDSQIIELFKNENPKIEDIQKVLNDTVAMHDQLLIRHGSRDNSMNLFPYPKGDKLSAKQAKSIAKREKRNKSKYMRTDTVEDPYFVKKEDHYVVDQHRSD